MPWCRRNAMNAKHVLFRGRRKWTARRARRGWLCSCIVAVCAAIMSKMRGHTAMQSLSERFGPSIDITTLREQTEFTTLLDAASRVGVAPLAEHSCMRHPLALPSGVDRAARCLMKHFAASSQCSWQPDAPIRVNFTAFPIEFGYEIFQVVPDAYALCRLGILDLHAICDGSLPVFFFAGPMLRTATSRPCRRYQERPGYVATREQGQDFARQHRPPSGAFWRRQPPFRATFRLPMTGRTAYVFNKWSRAPLVGVKGTRSVGVQGRANSWSHPPLVQ